MRYLRIAFLFLASTIALTLTAQVAGHYIASSSKRKITVEQPNLKDIKEKTLDPGSRYYFPKLMKRYLFGRDTTMTQEEFRYLYLGYMFQEDFDPYRTSKYSDVYDELRMKNLHSNAEIDSIRKYAELSFLDNPFDLRQISFLIYTMKEKKKDYYARAFEFKLENILAAIKSTGTGETPENAFYVISPIHEYDLIKLLGYEAVDAQFLEPGIDYISVVPTEETKRRLGNKVAKGFYFNVEIPTAQYTLKHPEIK